MQLKTKVKLCGLSRIEDILYANDIMPDYIGFVFAKKSIRYVDDELAGRLKAALSGDIKAVGVFVNEAPERIAALLNDNVIDIAQLHGGESEKEISEIRRLTDKPLIQAFRITSVEDVINAEASPADHILLDAGAGAGQTFDWSLLKDVSRPYFLAGGLSCDNVTDALGLLEPYAVDVSSGIETNGNKDKTKMKLFTDLVRRRIL